MQSRGSSQLPGAAATVAIRAATRLTAALTVALALAAAAGTASAAAASSRRTPTRNCDRGNVTATSVTIDDVDRCRAKEGVGPLELPSNYAQLTIAEQMLVVIDLERVNRGYAPIVGLSRSLSRIAQSGANREGDPSFPARGFSEGGAIWAFAFGVMGADLGWMYDDGWGSRVTNTACTSPGASGCWLHRRIILMHPRERLVAGGGARRIPVRGLPAAHSYAFEILAGYSRAHLTFTWAHELRYFAHRPGREPLAR